MIGQILLYVVVSIGGLAAFLVITMMAVQALRYWLGDRNDKYR